VGSANYLSPEALKLNYSEKSDIWAFGVIAYKFYYNYLPFEGENNL
jgi:serine/threonine protein kinase